MPIFLCQTAGVGGVDLAGLLSNPGFMTMVSGRDSDSLTHSHFLFVVLTSIKFD